MKVLIVGGGIGGITAAIALQRVGIEAHVYERAPEIREVGAGISLWANAIRMLDLLGLGDAIRSRALSNAAAGIRDRKGKILSTVSIGELERRFGSAVAVVHRAELIEVLRNALKDDSIHLGHELASFAQDGNTVTAQFTNNVTVKGDLLVGADGLNSVVRSRLLNDGPPRYSGYTGWRAVVNFSRPSLAPSESWGPGRRFGVVPMIGGRVYWFATQNAKEGERDKPGQTKVHLQELFRGWHEPIESILETTEESAILRNDIYDREPISNWSKGQVTLLGDAAHPTTPNLGQGGCQAIEDGVVLAACLAPNSNAEAALREYEARRVPRTRGIVLSSRRIGALAQLENPALSFLRNLTIRFTPQSISEQQLNSVVAYEPLTETEKSFFSKN